MNLIERIEEALEIYDNKFITLERQDFIEFLQLAKLGQAALKTTCKTLPPEISNEYCDPDCEMQDFCKLRQEVTQ